MESLNNVMMPQRYCICSFVVCLLLFLHYPVAAQKLVSQPLVGHTTSQELHVWGLFKNADTVFIRLKNLQQEVLQQESFVFSSKACYKKYMPVTARFSGLTDNTPYMVEYSFDRQQFHPFINARTDKDTIDDFSFLAGSCAFIGTGFNGAIKPFNSLEIFSTLQQDSADMMVWLGDNLYYLLQRQQYKAQLKRNVKTRLNKKLSAFLGTAQHYAIWDDHDYGTNNSDASFRNKTSSLSVFQQFWPNPLNDSNNYYTFQKQDAGFFMLDDRYNMEHTAVVLGKTQLEWLKQELLKSKATFKFIGIGMQALNPLSTMECFYKTGGEYRELVTFIKAHHISGVLFISGDRHHAELMKVQEDGLYPLYDFTTSPLTMYPVKISPKSPEYNNPYRVPGTYFPSYNYGKISLTGEKGGRKCTLQIKDKAGNIIWTYTVSETELK